jgi:hypothetical protein
VIFVSVINKITKELDEFGGYLECQTCGRKSPVGDIGNNLSSGWKKCCGYTMRWITKNELKNGR